MTSATASSRSLYIPSLDGIRACAVMLVFVGIYLPRSGKDVVAARLCSSWAWKYGSPPTAPR